LGTVTVGFLHSLIRKEEKLLIGEFEKRRNLELVMLDEPTSSHANPPAEACRSDRAADCLQALTVERIIERIAAGQAGLSDQVYLTERPDRAIPPLRRAMDKASGSTRRTLTRRRADRTGIWRRTVSTA